MEEGVTVTDCSVRSPSYLTETVKFVLHLTSIRQSIPLHPPGVRYAGVIVHRSAFLVKIIHASW